MLRRERKKNCMICCLSSIIHAYWRPAWHWSESETRGQRGDRTRDVGDESELKRKVEKEEKQMIREVPLIFQKQACLTKKETGEEERRDVKDRWNGRFFTEE